VNASGFKVSLLFGGSSKERIGGKSRPRAIFLNPQHSNGCQRGEGEQREFSDLPRTTFTTLVISAASSLVVKAIRSNGVGQKGFRIIIRT
jgi:hypothetical protein